MSLQVIGVGWGRTGTLSLKSALEVLGFGPCYHMVELLRNPEHVEHWDRALSSGQAKWDSLFRGYAAAVDYPACGYWQQLGRHFTNAKYILTVRDPDTWYESVRATIYDARPGILGRLKIMLQLPFSKRRRQLLNVFRHIERSIWQTEFLGRFNDKDFAIGRYRDHIEGIKQTIGPDKLLVYDVASGWAPLCEFLSVDVPDLCFPYLNRRDQFPDVIREFL